MHRWIEDLRSQSELAKNMSRRIPEALASPDLTQEQAEKLLVMIQRASDAVGALHQDLIMGVASAQAVEIAEALAAFWERLGEEAFGRMREMQGLQSLVAMKDG